MENTTSIANLNKNSESIRYTKEDERITVHSKDSLKKSPKDKIYTEDDAWNIVNKIQNMFRLFELGDDRIKVACDFHYSDILTLTKTEISLAGRCHNDKRQADIQDLTQYHDHILKIAQSTVDYDKSIKNEEDQQKSESPKIKNQLCTVLAVLSVALVVLIARNYSKIF